MAYLFQRPPFLAILAFFLFSFGLHTAIAAEAAKKIQPPEAAAKVPPPQAADTPNGDDLESEAENEFLNSSEAPDADDIELED